MGVRRGGGKSRPSPPLENENKFLGYIGGRFATFLSHGGLDLSMHLNSSGIGGYLGTAFINHLCYADDLCLISLSSSGMQQL